MLKVIASDKVTNRRRGKYGLEQGRAEGPYLKREGSINLDIYAGATEFLVGGVAKWLERRSLTGELSTPDLWLTCHHFVG